MGTTYSGQDKKEKDILQGQKTKQGKMSDNSRDLQEKLLSAKTIYWEGMQANDGNQGDSDTPTPGPVGGVGGGSRLVFHEENIKPGRRKRPNDHKRISRLRSSRP